MAARSRMTALVDAAAGEGRKDAGGRAAAGEEAATAVSTPPGVVPSPGLLGRACLSMTRRTASLAVRLMSAAAIVVPAEVGDS